MREHPVPGDEVDVLEHDDGRCQLPRQPAHGPGDPQRSAGEDDHGRAVELRGQPLHGVRLAGSRRSVQQQAALEMTVGGPQRVGAAADPERVSLDVREHLRRKDDVVAADRRALVEHDLNRAPHRRLHRHDLSAEDVESLHRAAQLVEEARREAVDRRHHLDLEAAALARAVLPDRADEQRRRAGRVVQQREAVLHARVRLAPGRPAGSRTRPTRAWPPACARGHRSSGP